MTDKDLTCPVCGKGHLSAETWREEGHSNRRTRALWATPYLRRKKAWLYNKEITQEYDVLHGVVEKAIFGQCGYQDIETGLTLVLKLESGGDVAWTFYNIGDIAEFLDRAKVASVEKIRGTPVLTYWSKGSAGWGDSIKGIDVVDSLVL